MGNVVQHIQTSHALPHQKVGGMGTLVFKNGCQNITGIHLFPTGKTHVHECTLHHAFQSVGLLYGQLGILRYSFHVPVEKNLKVITQPPEVTPAGHNNLGTEGVLGQRI